MPDEGREKNEVVVGVPIALLHALVPANKGEGLERRLLKVSSGLVVLTELLVVNVVD